MKVIIDIIQRHSIAAMVDVSPRIVMFTYGKADEIKDMIRDIEEEFHIRFSDGDYDASEIGKWTVGKFIDYVEQRVMLKELVDVVKSDYLDDDPSRPDDTDVESLLESAPIGITDLCETISTMKSTDGYTLHVTIRDESRSYAEMASRFVLFNGDETPIFGIFVEDVMSEHAGMLEGLKISGVERIFDAIGRNNRKEAI